MRCYSEGEIKRIVEREPIALHQKELSPIVTADSATDRESLEVLHLVTDLEFEMKFEMLIRSISYRLPHW